MIASNYMKDKEDCFKSIVSKRKKEIGFITKKQNNTNDSCEKCYHFNAFSPSMNRCNIISFTFEYRVASISLFSVCNEFTKDSNKKKEQLEKYKNIEFEDIGMREVMEYIKGKE